MLEDAAIKFIFGGCSSIYFFSLLSSSFFIFSFLLLLPHTSSSSSFFFIAQQKPPFLDLSCSSCVASTPKSNKVTSSGGKFVITIEMPRSVSTKLPPKKKTKNKGYRRQPAQVVATSASSSVVNRDKSRHWKFEKSFRSDSILV